MGFAGEEGEGTPRASSHRRAGRIGESPLYPWPARPECPSGSGGVPELRGGDSKVATSHWPAVTSLCPPPHKLPLLGGSSESRRKLTFMEHLLGARRDHIQSP